MSSFFLNHSKQHSSKTIVPVILILDRFGTIRNNTALKQNTCHFLGLVRFGTIRNNTALKLQCARGSLVKGFGTIRNNTALKRQLG